MPKVLKNSCSERSAQIHFYIYHFFYFSEGYKKLSRRTTKYFDRNFMECLNIPISHNGAHQILIINILRSHIANLIFCFTNLTNLKTASKSSAKKFDIFRWDPFPQITNNCILSQLFYHQKFNSSQSNTTKCIKINRHIDVFHTYFGFNKLLSN